jgi:hypothetical protein
MTTVEANGVTLGVAHFGDAAAPLGAGRRKPIDQRASGQGIGDWDRVKSRSYKPDLGPLGWFRVSCGGLTESALPYHRCSHRSASG